MSIKLTLGQRIYYTGDMANAESAGVVTAISGTAYTLDLDDGRVFRGISPLAFEPGPGRRFWLLEEWLEHRAAAYEKFVSATRKAVQA